MHCVKYFFNKKGASLFGEGMHPYINYSAAYLPAKRPNV